MSRAGREEDVPAGWAGELVHLFKRLMMTSGADPVTGKPPSLREIARRAGYVPSHVRNIINGKGRPSLDAILAVAHALNATAEDLQRASFYAGNLQQAPHTESTNAGRAARPKALLNWAYVAGAASGSLIGRDAEIERLYTWLLEASQGHGRFVMIEGEPGIGKSSLMRGVALEGAQRGCRVIWATCDELSQAFSLLPLVDAFDRQAPAPGDGYPSAADILRSGSAPGDQTNLARRATERLLVLIDQLCATTTVLLAVDDIQWADHATLVALARLARMAERSSVLVMTAVRPIPRRHDLDALRDLTKPETLVALRGLTGTKVIELITAMTGGVPGPQLLRLADRASGNPLYLTELVDKLGRDHRLAVESGATEVVRARASDSPSSAIADRLRFVSAPTREMLRMAALLGTDFSVSELTVVIGQRVRQLLSSLDEAVAAGILQADGTDLAFRHPLIRDALYDEIPLAVRIAWHLESAHALADVGAPVNRVARQLLPVVEGGAPADVWAIRWLAGAALQLLGQASAAATVRLLRWALAGRSTGVPAGGYLYDSLACRLADALFRTGDAAAADVASRALAHITHPDLMVDLHWTLAQCRAMAGQFDDSLATLENALRFPDLERRHRARILVLIARTHRSVGRIEAAGQAAAAALEEATASDDRWAIAWSLTVLFIVDGMRGEPLKALALLYQASAAVEGDPALSDLELVLWVNRAATLSDLGRDVEAFHSAERARDLANGTGNVVRLAQAESVLIELLFDIGRWDEALTATAQARGSSDDRVVQCCNQGIAAAIEFHRDDNAADRSLDRAERSAVHLGDVTIVPFALAKCLAQERAGNLPAALAVLTRDLSTEDRSSGLKLLAEATRLAVAVGDLEAANDFATRADSFARGSDLAYRGAVARHCRGLVDRDPGLLLDAADQYRRSGRPLPQAQALEAAGLAFVDEGDAIRAMDAFKDALSAYTLLAATWDVTRIQQHLKEIGPVNSDKSDVD
jgi:tetratricopeptide (TPR) repeat protein/transcriptional regulator with XRE-family HTH domain